MRGGHCRVALVGARDGLTAGFIVAPGLGRRARDSSFFLAREQCIRGRVTFYATHFSTETQSHVQAPTKAAPASASSLTREQVRAQLLNGPRAQVAEVNFGA